MQNKIKAIVFQHISIFRMVIPQSRRQDPDCKHKKRSDEDHQPGKVVDLIV